MGLPRLPLRHEDRSDTWQEEHRLITRLLALRRAGKIGPILAEHGRYWICESELDPHGSKVSYSKAELYELLMKLE